MIHWNMPTATFGLDEKDLSIAQSEVDSFLRNTLAGKAIGRAIEIAYYDALKEVRMIGRGGSDAAGIIAQGQLDVLERLRERGLGMSEYIDRRLAKAKAQEERT